MVRGETVEVILLFIVFKNWFSSILYFGFILRRFLQNLSNFQIDTHSRKRIVKSKKQMTFYRKSKNTICPYEQNYLFEHSKYVY